MGQYQIGDARRAFGVYLQGDQAQPNDIACSYGNIGG